MNEDVILVQDLPTAWRTRAADLRRYSADERVAHALEVVADELTAALRFQADELLTLEEASAESGFTADHLGR